MNGINGDGNEWKIVERNERLEKKKKKWRKKKLKQTKKLSFLSPDCFIAS